MKKWILVVAAVGVGALSGGFWARAQDASQDASWQKRVEERLDSIEQSQQDILKKLEGSAASDDEIKAKLDEVQQSLKSYVKPKWTP